MKISANELAGYRPGRVDGALVVIQGNEADLGTHCVLDRPVTLGRDLDVELPLRDIGISRRHARVERDANGGYVVADLGSTNGTRLNGDLVTEPTPLGEGDKVILGATVLRFTFGDETDAHFHEKLAEAISTDHLTGLVSRRRFDAEYHLAVATSRRTGRPLAVIMMDLDDLKSINDTHGHHMGSFALAETGRIIGETVGLEGPASRYGGDEFATYLPGYSKVTGVKLAERVRRAVEKHRFELEGEIIAPTISLGVAAYPEDGDDAARLLRRADEALYRAKAAGRNRVSI